ncbi:MAG TPA: HlyD family efflux transporter periplasmic adaptor subunit, partial [Mycobacteriales bacterium]|nr:HlyD family efflux transporter periplasmic adaptor subunit [Mycobacteriales bacterium]
MPKPRSRTTRRLLVVGAVIVVAAAAGSTAWALTRPAGPSYRTAAVTRGTVDQTLTTTGELSPMRYADDDFQVAGKVAKVDVKVGDHVVAGHALAHLHRATLKAAVRTANAELTSARERLSEDESGQSSVGTSSTTDTTATDVSYRAATATSSPRPQPSGSPGGTGSSPSGPGTGGHRGPVTTATLRADQRAIVRAQRAVDRALASAKIALKTEATACASETGSPSGGASSNAQALSCTAAAKALLHDQQVVSADETALDQAEQVLSGDLATAEKALKGKGSSGSKSTGSRGGQSALNGSTSTVSAADLASDQASIDTDRAQVATAKANLSQATLHATISGRVAAVTIDKGDSVSGSASSTSPAVEIIGSHQDKATVYVSDAQVRRTKVGQSARITPDGTSRSVSGRVVAVGISGSESDSGSITYPVTVDVADPSSRLVAGADAAVSITLATA